MLWCSSTLKTHISIRHTLPRDKRKIIQLSNLLVSANAIYNLNLLLIHLPLQLAVLIYLVLCFVTKGLGRTPIIHTGPTCALFNGGRSNQLNTSIKMLVNNLKFMLLINLKETYFSMLLYALMLLILYYNVLK